jgi:hypothetical protein
MKKPYQKPMFRRVSGLGFVLTYINTGWKALCRQCSGCHGCR